MEKRIEKERTYPHPIEQVWKAISDDGHISRWFIQADFKPQVGYAYTFTHEETRITGVVKVARPVHELVYTWQVNDGPETLVSWHLKEADTGTVVRLEHTGSDAYPNEQMAIEAFGHFEKGWENCMKDLSKYLEEYEIKST